MKNYNRTWTEQDIDFVWQNFIEYGEKYCAEKLGRTPMSILARAKTLKYNLTKFLSESDATFIEKFYPILGYEFCQSKLNKEPRAIRQYIRQGRLFRIPLSEVNVTSYLLEFIGEWTPQFVYILGLIWADGSLRCDKNGSYSASFGLVSKDGEDVGPCLDYFGIWKWSKYIQKERRDLRKNGKISISKESVQWKIGNVLFGQFLYENGYKDKSGGSAEKILSIIPSELQHYWWRGFFEGDGHIKPHKWPKIQIAGPLKQDWTFLEILLNSLGIVFSVYRNFGNGKGQSSQVSFGKIDDVICFCEYIWKGREEDQIGLKRKYETYKSKNYQPAPREPLKDQAYAIIPLKTKQSLGMFTLKGNFMVVTKRKKKQLQELKK